MKNIVCNAHMKPIDRTRYDPCPKIVNKKSDMFAPRGPPKLLMMFEEFLLKKAESEES